MATVKWTRMVLDEYRGGEAHSKCGRFRVTRHTWVLPVATTSYVLHDGSDEHDCETLREAKELAQCIVDDEATDAAQEEK
jgi:hypothetical protein